MALVLDINLFNGSINDAIGIILDNTICTGNAKCISATGAHGIIHAYRNPSFKKILQSFFLNLPDGMPGVWISKIKGDTNIKRCYGPDFFKDLIIATSSSPSTKHFFCGGKEGVVQELKVVCEKKFNNSNIVGIFSPPFREMTDDEMIELGNKITLSGANIVWIGLSTPKQELFAHRLKGFTKVNFIITVGAAFDFHTGKVKQAPSWIQKIGMEWLFRLTMEPKRLWKRYVRIIPLFIYYNIIEMFIVKNFKNKRVL